MGLWLVSVGAWSLVEVAPDVGSVAAGAGVGVPVVVAVRRVVRRRSSRVGARRRGPVPSVPALVVTAVGTRRGASTLVRGRILCIGIAAAADTSHTAVATRRTALVASVVVLLLRLVLRSAHSTALGLALLLLLLGDGARDGDGGAVDGELGLLDELLHHCGGGEGGEGEATEGLRDVEV